MYIVSLGPRFSGLDGAGDCLDNEKVLITQIYLCNAHKMKWPFLATCKMNFALCLQKNSCKLYHWGPMDPRFQKSIWP